MAARIVLANGCFDLLHVAHVRHLQEARQQGDLLIVSVTKDAHVGKAGRPIIPAVERLEMITALQCVTSAFLCSDSLEALRAVRPHVFCKGHDYLGKGLLAEEIAYCAENGIEIFHTGHNPQTTSGIIERIKCES